jgi:hypothetical protein
MPQEKAKAMAERVGKVMRVTSIRETGKVN